MEVRRATNGDWYRMSDLMLAQNRFHAALVPHIVKRVTVSQTETWCRTQLCDPDVAVFMAMVDGDNAIGIIMVRTKRYPESEMVHGVDLAYIDELFVMPEHRRRGIGTRLIEQAGEYARSQRLSALSLNVWGANADAISAYRALGFDTVYQRMTLPLQ